MNEQDNLFGSIPEGTLVDSGDPFGGGILNLGSVAPSEDPFAEAPTISTQPTPQILSFPESGNAVQRNPPPPTESGSVGTAIESQHETPPAPSNPLLAGMEQAEEQTLKKAAEPVMAQAPVFSYNGSTEDIEDLDQTFDELREAKSTDFPEFDKGDSVSWSVTYGKISKGVTNPKKVKIGAIKREIEGSREFLDALKKSKDKSPKCLVKPRVYMEKKGIASYKGIFPNLEEARQSDKTICLIPARDGKVYELRRGDAGTFLTTTKNAADLDEISAGFIPALPPIPYALFEQIVSLFRSFLFERTAGGPSEALAQVFWDRKRSEYFIHVPTQEVSKAQVVARLDCEALFDTDRYLHYADVHSHNTMEARFSATDDQDERANRVYIVVGRLDKYYPDLSVRICNGGSFLPICPQTVLEPRPKSHVPQDWLDNITVLPFGEKSELMAA